MLPQKSEHESEHYGVNEHGSAARRARHEDTVRTRGNGEKNTRAESHKEHGSHQEICPGKHETHQLGDTRVDCKKHESVEKHGHAIGFHGFERRGDVDGQGTAIGFESHAGTEE